MQTTFTTEAKDDRARAGIVHTARGSFTTPCFMPVGTRGAVKHLSSLDLESLGAQVVLANTYHLMLRPGPDIVEELGGLGRFANWSGHTLTDSGGFQIFSLEPKVDDQGATFKSIYDGSKYLLTPELAVKYQAQIGADIQMVLDVCAPLPSSPQVISDAVDRTTAWARRGRDAFLAGDTVDHQHQFGIVQGGVDVDQRRRSASEILDVGFDGYAIGGLSVGEDRRETAPALAAVTEMLPADQPRYFMGLGDPIGIVEAVACGVDMFDCVLPTRLARHGTMLTSAGRVNITRAEFANSNEPIDPGLPEDPTAGFSKGYLRHLFQVKEFTGARLLTLHNLYWLLHFVDEVRAAIVAGEFDAFRQRTHDVWG